MPGTDRPRCAWAGEDPLYQRYHDEEWGVPQRDDRVLFEFLLLEGAQAGLSWITILRKREAYRKAFAGFDPANVAKFGPAQVEKLMGNAGIVRNRLKIESAAKNARAFLDVQTEHGSFADFAWSFVGGKPIVNHRGGPGNPTPATTPESDAFSKAMLKRGFKFVGSTIMYAWMQACGLVDDHAVTCWRARR